MDLPPCSVLFGNEPRLYRESFGTAIELLRPQIEVMVVDPLHVEATLHRHHPCLLVCSHLTDAIRATEIDWLVLPAGEDECIVARSGGVPASYRTFTLDDLLTVIDRAVARREATRTLC